MPLKAIPLPDEPSIYLYSGGNRHGPISRRELQDRLTSGEVRRSDVFWYKGQEGWLKISDHSDLLEDLIPLSPPQGTQAISSASRSAIGRATPRIRTLTTW